MTTGRRVGALALGALLTALLVAWVTDGTLAVFSDRATVTAGPAGSPPGGPTTAFTSGSLATPATPARTQTAPAAVTLTWPATAVGELGGTAQAYDVVRYGAATGGSGTVVCSTTGAVSCADTTAPATTAWYAVRARVGTGWTSESARAVYQPDTAAPTVVIQTPLNGCAAIACGTASDTGGSTVASVSYALRRTLTGAVTGSQSFDCWNGSAWVASTAGATCPSLPATGTTSWTVPGAKATAYTNLFLYAESFTLTVRATDAVGNQGAPVGATYSQ